MAGLAFTISLADLVSAPSKRMQASLMGTKDGLLAMQAASLSSAKAAKAQQVDLLAASKAMMAENQSAALLEKSITALERAQAKSATTGNVGAYRKQSRDLAALRDELTRTDTSGLRMAESLGRQATAAGQSARAFTDQANAAGLSAKVTGEEAATAGESAEALGALAGAATIAATAVLALAAGMAKLVITGAEFTISAVQSKQAAQQMFHAMAGGKDAGDQLFAMMEDLATQLPQTKDELTAWSKEFTAMGILKTDALRGELRATASAAALMGDEGAEAFTTLTRKIVEASTTSGKLKIADKQLASLAKTGANVSDVAKVLGVSSKTLSDRLKAGTQNAMAFGDALSKALIAKGVEPLNTLAGSVKSLSAKFQEAIADMFEDVDISPFVDQMKGLLDVFAQAEPSGQVMKGAIGGFFKQFFDWSAKAVLVAKHMFLQLIIWGLKAYIALKPFAGFFKAFTIGALIVAGVITGLLMVALGLLVGAIGAILAPMAAGAALAYEAYEAFESWGGLSGIVNSAVTAVTAKIRGWITSLGGIASEIKTWAIDTASHLVDGFVNGIKNGYGLVTDAMHNLAKGAMDSFKHMLGIASPSKVFMQFGGFVGKGFTAGVVAQNDNAASATKGLADAAMGGAAQAPASPAPADKPVATPAPAASGKSSSITVNVMPGAVVINGAAGDATELTEHAVSLIFEKIALSQGVAA